MHVCEGLRQFYPGLADVGFSENFTRNLSLLISKVSTSAQWLKWSTNFCHISIEPNGDPIHDFLFLNRKIKKSRLLSYLTVKELSTFLASKTLLEIGDDEFLLPVTILPHGDTFYIYEAKQILGNPDAYDVFPAHINSLINFQVNYVKRYLGNQKISNFLEMGSGIGIVSLELQERFKYIDGAELMSRNHKFSVANKYIRNYKNVNFYESDLFSNVKGRYGLILFAPWAPTEKHLDLITRFLLEAGNFLKENGTILLMVETESIPSSTLVEKHILNLLKQKHYIAKKDIFSCYYTETNKQRNIGESAFYQIQLGNSQNMKRKIISEIYNKNSLSKILRRSILPVMNIYDSLTRVTR